MTGHFVVITRERSDRGDLASGLPRALRALAMTGRGIATPAARVRNDEKELTRVRNDESELTHPRKGSKKQTVIARSASDVAISPRDCHGHCVPSQ